MTQRSFITSQPPVFSPGVPILYCDIYFLIQIKNKERKKSFWVDTFKKTFKIFYQRQVFKPILSLDRVELVGEKDLLKMKPQSQENMKYLPFKVDLKKNI